MPLNSKFRYRVLKICHERLDLRAVHLDSSGFEATIEGGRVISVVWRILTNRNDTMSLFQGRYCNKRGARPRFQRGIVSLPTCKVSHT